MAEVAGVTSWVFQQEIPIPQDVVSLMVPGEQPFVAYATFRGSAILTTKRLIVRDVQGLRGKKWKCIRYRICRLLRGRWKNWSLWAN